MSTKSLEVCHACGRPLEIIIDGDHVTGGRLMGGETNQEGMTIMLWECKECVFQSDYEDT